MCDMGGACNGATAGRLRRAGRVPAILSMIIKRVVIDICEACLRGEGQECHTPGCAFFLHRVDLPIHEGIYTVVHQYDDTRAQSPELAQVREALETLAAYPVAREYPDGPRLTRYDMQDVKQALAALNALMGRAKP